LLPTSAHQEYYLTWWLAQLGVLELPADLESFLDPEPRRGLTGRLPDIRVTVFDPPIEVLSMQPESTEGDRCIDFAEIGSHADRRDDPLSQAFARHSFQWRAPAGSEPPTR